MIIAVVVFSHPVFSQDRMTPESLWKLGRVSAIGISADGKSLEYSVGTPSMAENKINSKQHRMPISGGPAVDITGAESLVKKKDISPDGKFKVILQEVKVKKVSGKDFYPELEKSNVQIYDALNYRHWDTWEDGAYGHIFLNRVDGSSPPKDIMEGEAYDCPQKPFGGEEDFTWSPDSKQLVYVTKKKFGTAYAVSTNTDIYSYEVSTGLTTNLSEGMMGYDTYPSFSSQGTLAWLSMKRDGYEADKNDIVAKAGPSVVNLTQHWDGTVIGFVWSADGRRIYFTAPVDGTIQLFEVDFPGLTKKVPVVRQITKGDFDLTGIVGQTGNTLVVSRTDMNHATELYSVNLSNGQLLQLTHVNDSFYQSIKLSRIERRYVTTTDNKQMLVWVIYPPDFDASRKYPALLYCEGGPQSPLSQFYSFRWNLQLMAANGYIIVAPDRRGMPGFGVQWNEQISRDWGGQAMQDLLSAIDHVATEKFVDRSRLGCVGASFGGYSVFYLAGIHQNRFKSFIAHDGTFNMKSMYGTTEEMWFVNWDMGGPYWEKNKTATQKSYTDFDPSSKVDQWNTPILIFHGAKDFRVPLGQGLEAFTAAQSRGIKSKLVVLPEENHWVLTPQNAMVWQREFYAWLRETL